MDENGYHFSHKLDRLHYFSLNDDISDETCSMCGLSICGIGYECEDCYTYMHKSCGELLPQHIDHSLHPLHQPLTLLNIRSSNDTTTATTTTCYYCDETFQSHERWAYACNQCSLYMHTSCALIPLPTIKFQGDQENDVARYVCHEHPVILVGDDSGEGHANCCACQSRWSGPAYSCTFTKCQNFIHKWCAERPQKIQHPFHPHHLLKLQVSDQSQSCRSCRKKGWLIFSCEENGCNFNLCIECASDHMIIVEYQSHDHSLLLAENVKASWDIQCDACQKSYKKRFNHIVTPDEVNYTKSFFFRCIDCDFNLHFLCGPLLSVVTCDYHIHPLILVDNSAIEDDFDQYYCDVCEEERDSQFRVYHCEECKYIAHIHCLKHEIMKVINKKDADTSNEVELWALGEHRWKLGRDQLRDGKYQTKRMSLTLRDIMDTLISQHEKEILIHPFPSDEIDRIRMTHDYSRKLNSRFDELGSIDDFDRLKQFLQIDFDSIYNLSREIRCYTGEGGGLKVEEKYLRQEVVEVSDIVNGGNYKVMIPKTLAPIFKTLLLKHGHHDDLHGRSGLTDGMRSVGSTLLSILIDKICRTKVEDVTMDHLKQWHFYLLGIQQITGFNLYLYMNSLSEMGLYAYLGFKAVRSKKEANENLYFKIATLEAELERYKKNREEFRTIEPQKSSAMEECLCKASEIKRKTLGDLWF